ncbi:MAG: hypothetical protein K6T56_00865 [Burkholderiales bacterium]|nr:hypothetical protein [Burkholderiales bacterium]
MRWLLLCLGLFLSPPLLAATDVFTVHTPAADIPVTRHQAAGKRLLLWLPSEYGVLAEEHRIAEELARRGWEVWLADLYAARFLPTVASSAEALPAEDVAALIDAALARTRQVWLVTAGRGAKYALEGARLRQSHARQPALAGAVLLYPNLYVGQPEPGTDPVYLPITRDTRLSLHILQGELSPWYWTLDTLKAAFEAGGSRVRVQTFSGIRDRFYFRPDATAEEKALAARLPELISQTLREPPTGSRR